MELKPYNVDNTLKNIERVFKNKNIEKLNGTGYNFLYLMSGFIAHYDLHGFQNNYTDLRELISDLKLSIHCEKNTCLRDVNDIPKHNGHGLPYCQSKLDIVNGIEKIVKKYEKEIEVEFKKIEKAEIKNEISRLQNQLATM